MIAFRATLVACVFLLAPAAAAAEIELYGRIDLSVQYADEAGEGQVELRNNASRVGVRGELALRPGLEAIYQLEFGVDLDDQADRTFTHRNQFVGLQGAFGAVKLGRNDTALKESGRRFDLFDDTEGDVDGPFNGEHRLKNYIGYVSPAFAGGVTATLNFFPGENSGAGADGVADAASASLVYRTDALHAAIAYDMDVEGEGVDTTRMVGGYTLGPARLMVLYQRTDTGVATEDGFGVSMAWESGSNTAKLQYLAADFWRLDPRADPFENRYRNLLSVGLDHKLGEDTRLSGFYTVGDIGGTSEKRQYVGIGLQHNF